MVIDASDQGDIWKALRELSMIQKGLRRGYSASSNKNRFTRIVSQIFEGFRLISEEAVDGATFIREMGLRQDFCHNPIYLFHFLNLRSIRKVFLLSDPFFLIGNNCSIEWC